MRYVHVDTYESQSSKFPGSPCGDVISCHRDATSTTIILSDGLGSGVRANIYAHLCTARIQGLLASGCSARRAFRIMAESMNESWGSGDPFAVFSMIRILLNGETSVLSYDSPAPLLVSSQYAYPLDSRVTDTGKAEIRESHTILKAGEGLLVFSDGVSQAGMGKAWPLGWESKGVAEFLSTALRAGQVHPADIPLMVIKQARTIWGDQHGDDCSLVYAGCRNGIIVNLLTGPPSRRQDDEGFVDQFLASTGFKIICGGSTAQMLSRVSHKELSIHEDHINHLSPVGYNIKGIDLVTEGMVTLNQVCNILDEEIPDGQDDSPVTELCRLLNLADRVNIWCGSALNTGESHLMFKQQGLLPRQDIIPVLERKLKNKGKLVVVNNDPSLQLYRKCS